MVIVPNFSNLFPGLAEGPIEPNAKVINAINSSVVAFIGNVVEVDTISGGTPEGSLLPRVSGATVAGGPTIGVEVGGQRKGIYTDSRSFSLSLSTVLKDPALIATQGEVVRVCTQGVCIATVVTRTGSDIKIGDPLTTDFFANVPEDFLSGGTLVKATSGDFVIARALQPVPTGTPSNPEARFAAVNIQREGNLS